MTTASSSSRWARAHLRLHQLGAHGTVFALVSSRFDVTAPRLTRLGAQGTVFALVSSRFDVNTTTVLATRRGLQPDPSTSRRPGGNAPSSGGSSTANFVRCAGNTSSLIST